VAGSQLAIDLNDPAYLADPYPTYAALRAEAPVQWAEGLGWLVLRHDDISALLHDPRMASGPLNDSLYTALSEESLAEVEPFRTAMRHNMLLQDPPDHTRLRRLVSQAFTPRQIELLRGSIQRIADGLLDAAEPGQPFDAIGDFAFPLPARVIADLLGVPWEDIARLKAWNDAGVDFLGNALSTPDPAGLAHRVGTMYQEQRAYFEELIARHRAAPSFDLICALIAIRDADGDRLTEDELLSSCGLLFAAGHETTTNLIGNGLLALLRNPEQLRLLVEEPDLLPAAVDELTRYDSPVQFVYRVATEPVVLRGQTIPVDGVLMLLLGSGNHDPEAFAEPDRLDVRRRPRHYLSFGTGAHACLGAFLARLEATVALGALLKRFPSPTLVDEPLVWHANPIFHGVERLPVLLQAQPRS
jgi:cytochrome P450